jgi:hypothetical protein
MAGAALPGGRPESIRFTRRLCSMSHGQGVALRSTTQRRLRIGAALDCVCLMVGVESEATAPHGK